MTRLLLATTNRDKLREIREILDGLPLTVVTLADFPGVADLEETGETFAENARVKAVYYATATGELTAADDSGLEIDALDGAPGVSSSRFDGASYLEKFQAIYDRLDARGVAGARARFVCAVALAGGAGLIYETTAAVEGEITRSPRGHEGFGYDPIFYYPPYGRTLAEVSRQEKSAVSHRGRAFRQLRAFLAARVAALALAVGGSAGAGCDTNPTGPDLPFRLVAEGSFGGFSSRTVAVARDAAAWATLAAGLRPARPPDAINFPSEMAAAVFLGERPTGGYRVRIIRVAPRSGGFEIDAIEEQPHPTCPVTLALTRPFAVIAIARTDLAISVEWSTATGPPCR